MHCAYADKLSCRNFIIFTAELHKTGAHSDVNHIATLLVGVSVTVGGERRLTDEDVAVILASAAAAAAAVGSDSVAWHSSASRDFCSAQTTCAAHTRNGARFHF